MVQIASRFNPEKQLWLIEQRIMNVSSARVVPLLTLHLDQLGIRSADRTSLDKVVEAFRQRAKTMKHMAQEYYYCFEDFKEIDAKGARKYLRPVVLKALVAPLNRFNNLKAWRASELSVAIEGVARQ